MERKRVSGRRWCFRQLLTVAWLTGDGMAEAARRGSPERDRKRDVRVQGNGAIESFWKICDEIFLWSVVFHIFLAFWMLFSSQVTLIKAVLSLILYLETEVIGDANPAGEERGCH